MTAAAQEERRLWSVTTLVETGFGKGDALIGWAARVVAERAYDKSAILGGYLREKDRAGAIKWLTDARWETKGAAAGRGTKVHRIIEQYALGVQPQIPEGFEPYDEQIRRYLAEHRPVFEAAEAPVYNLTYGYAGTLDSIQVVGGKRCIVDCKTTDKAPDELTPSGRPVSRPPYPEIALQQVGYARAELVGLSPATMRKHGGRRYYVYDPALEYAPLPEIEGALALVVSPYDYQLKPVRIDDEVWAAFGIAREAARWQLDTSRRVIGPDITPAYPQEATAS